MRGSQNCVSRVSPIKSGNYNFRSVIKSARGKGFESPGLNSPRKEMGEIKRKVFDPM